MLIWYLARAAGLTAYLAFSVATAAGALTSHRGPDPDRRAVLQYVHRSAALGGLVLLVVHIVTLLADSYANVGVKGLLPFGSGYRPFAVTLGVVAMYLLVAVALSGALRSRLVRSERATRLWRGIHLLAYASWALSAWHFLVVGTDSGKLWARVVLLAGIAVVLASVAVRLTDRSATARPTGGRLLGPAPVPVPVRVDARYDLARVEQVRREALRHGGRS